MNKHKEKCNHLKAIRKNMADALGVELNQTECTYEGDCKGTCPKCQQEEKKLSAVLLKGTAVATSAALMLAGCGTERIELNLEGDIDVSSLPRKAEEYIMGILPYEEVDELAGDVAVEDFEGEILEGSLEYIPENEE